MNDKEQKEKNKVWKFILVPVVILAVAGLTFFAYSQAKKLNKLPESKVTNTDPSSFVRLGTGVLEDMMTPDFWIENKKNSGTDTGKQLLSQSEIERFNYDNRRMISAMGNSFALEELGDQFYAKVAKKLAEDTMFTPAENTVYMEDDVRVPDDFWETATDNANIDSLTERINLRFGYSVVRTVLKRLPADNCVYEEGGGRYCDVLAQAEITPFMPVAVLYESKDGEWLYVLTQCCGGWVRKTGVALCKDRQEWLDRMDPENFIVVTGRELRLPSDPYNSVLSELSVPMGTVLQIVSIADAPENINDRVGFGNYICKLVTRNDEGMAEDAYVLVPANSDVHQGYLDYTEANVCELLFKHLGAEYGWAGDNNSVDCSGFVKQVYACFGYDMPRSSSEQAKISCSSVEYVEHSTVAKKLEILKDAPIGTLLHFNGHMMLYLGMVDGVPYCISSTESIAVLNEGKIDRLYVNTVILTSMVDTLRLDGRTWLEHLDTIVIP